MLIHQRWVGLVLVVLALALAGSLWVVFRTYQSERSVLEQHASDRPPFLSSLNHTEPASRPSLARVMAAIPHFDGEWLPSAPSLQQLETAAQLMWGAAGRAAASFPPVMEGRLLADAANRGLTAATSGFQQRWPYALLASCSRAEAVLPAGLRRFAAGLAMLLVAAMGITLWLSRGMTRSRARGAGRWHLPREAGSAEVPAHVAPTGSRERAEVAARVMAPMAHEINNLLGVISNSAHLVTRHANDPELQMPVAAMLRAVESASRLTDQMLRVGTSQVLLPRRIDLRCWLSGLKPLLGVVLGKRVALTLHAGTRPLPVRVDADELAFGLVSVALNLKGVLGGVGQVDITAAPFDGQRPAQLPERPYQAIHIEVTGPGLSGEKTTRVHRRLPPTSAAGAGSGMHHIRRICARLGGDAWLTTRADHSLVVCLLLPEALPAAPQDEPDPDGLGSSDAYSLSRL